MSNKNYKGLEDESMDTEENPNLQNKNINPLQSEKLKSPTEVYDSNRESIGESDSFPSTSIISSPFKVDDGRLSNLSSSSQKDKSIFIEKQFDR